MLLRDFPQCVQLMLLSARLELGAGEIDRVADLVRSDGLDWQEFLSVCRHHRLSSLVFETLDRVRPEGLPEFMRETLHREATGNAREALRFTAEVSRVTQLYASAGMELTVLKGVPLSQALFGKPNARHVGDIDLLTDPAHLREQLELLAGAGYVRVNPAGRLTPKRVASYVRFWKDATLENRSTGFEMDLHWRLFNNRFHPANRILSEVRYETISVFGVPMRVFPRQEQLLYIAAHGVADAFTYLKSMVDVAALLTILPEAELDAVLRKAQELGLLRQLSAAIHLSNEWMGTGCASERMLPASDRIAAEVRERATRALLRHNYKPDRSDTSPARWLGLERKLVPGTSPALELVGRYLWRPRLWNSVDLSDGLFWLYPLLGLALPPRTHAAGRPSKSPAAVAAKRTADSLRE